MNKDQAKAQKKIEKGLKKMSTETMAKGAPLKREFDWRPVDSFGDVTKEDF